MIKKLLFCTLFSFCFAISNAQFNYQAANAVVATGTYTDLGTSGTPINTKFNGGGTITYDDDTSSVQNIGFNFTYNGTVFTQFVLCTNGFIKLGNTAPASIYDVLTTFEANTISPYNIDLVGGTSPEYRLFTSGTTGSRVCTIQFKNVQDFSATVGQYTNINFQIKLYEGTNNIEFVYGAFSASAAASAILGTTNGIAGSSAANSVNATKASSTPWASATFINGAYTGNKFNNRNSVLPVSGQIYRFVAVSLPPNDAAVVNIFTLGKRPGGYGGNHITQATIRNAGSGTLTNLVVTLNITGANTFTNQQTVASLASGASTTVSFVGFNPTILGNNTITVSVPTDDVTTNNSVNVAQTITSNLISTAYAATTTLGVGFTGATGEFASKFINGSTKSIDQVTVYLPTTSTGQPATIIIYDATGTAGSPGTALWTSTPQTTAGANIVLPVSPAVSVTGDFFVSVQQTGTANVGIGYEVENPVRAGIFYLKTTGAWSDFSTGGNNFKLMIDARFSAGLPITLSSFIGAKQNSINLLNWSTSTETNNAGFNLEKSADGTNYSSLGFVASKATNGNSNITLNYEFGDSKPFTGNNYYRLKQTDKDGKTSYSQVVLLKGTKKSAIEVSVVYPNPVQNTLNVVVSAANADRVTVVITDVNGKILSQQATQLAIGDNNIKLNVSKLAAGNYTIQVISDNGTSEAKKFVKQ